MKMNNKDFGNLYKISSRMSPLHISWFNEIYVFASVVRVCLRLYKLKPGKEILSSICAAINKHFCNISRKYLAWQDENYTFF